MAVDFYISKQNFIDTLIVENTHPKLVSGYTIIQNTAYTARQLYYLAFTSAYATLCQYTLRGQGVAFTGMLQ